jgi:hypothetical protein
MEATKTEEVYPCSSEAVNLKHHVSRADQLPRSHILHDCSFAGNIPTHEKLPIDRLYCYTARFTQKVIAAAHVQTDSVVSAFPTHWASGEFENVFHDLEIQLKLLPIRFLYHFLDAFSQCLLTFL